MRCLLAGCVFAAVFFVMVDSAGAQQAGEWDAGAVEKAVEKAKAYLWSQWSDGHWKEIHPPGPPKKYSANYGGVTALCTYALLAAGESPQNPRMIKTLKWLTEVPMYGTYARSLRASVFAMLGRDSPYRRLLKKDVDWLVAAVDSRGSYNYIKGNRGRQSRRTWKHARYDNSNSQFAVLGVWAGAGNGVEVPRRYWELVEEHWKREQMPDGGWGYLKSRKQSYGSMSAAGLASAFICFDALYRKQFITCKARPDYDPIERGLKWMDKNFSPTTNPGLGRSYAYHYYLYGVERVGLASGYKYFGNKDWYKLGASNLLKTQGNSGNWTGRRDSVIETSFALLFLARGQHPVLFNKLKYPGSWNCRPRDLANLTRWITRTFEKRVNWQIIHLGVPVSEWHDAPILYISGATAPKFSDKDIEAIREFVHQGGVIFSEAACSQTAFNLAMRKYYAKMFPKYEMKRLSADHPVYNLHFKIRRRGLQGISNGVRLLAIHSPAQVSLAWQMNRYATETDTFHLAANVYFFVTDKGSLRKRGVSPWPRAGTFSPAETLKLAIVACGGNYEPEPLAWRRFSILMGNRHRVKVEVSGPVALTDLDAARWPAAAMTGTTAFELTDEQRAALRKYLLAGGTLIADAAGGSKAFAAAAEREFAKVLPEAEYGPIPSGHAIYTKAGPAVGKVSYRRAIRMSLADPNSPRLRCFSHNGRLAIIFSREDLTAGLVGYPCWGLAGYSPSSAFELMRNILLHTHGKTLGR